MNKRYRFCIRGPQVEQDKRKEVTFFAKVDADGDACLCVIDGDGDSRIVAYIDSDSGEVELMRSNISNWI